MNKIELNRKALILIFFILMFPFVFASTPDSPDYFVKKETNYNLRRIATIQGSSSSSLNCNLSIFYINTGNYLVDNQKMSNNFPSPLQNYSFNSSNTMGTYRGDMFCSGNGLNGTDTFYIEINNTGKPDPSGGLITFFIIVFLIIIGGLIYIMIYSFGHALKKDFDFIDLAFDWGVYFMLVAFFILQNQYLGNQTIFDITNVLVIVGAITHLFAPLIFLFISMIWANMEKYRQQTGVIK